MNGQAKRASAAWAYAALVLTTALWGGNWIIGRGFAGEIAPFALTFGRWSVAVAVLVPISLAAILRQRAIIAAEWRRLVVMAVLAITLVHAMVYYGLSKTTVINGALYASASPVFVIIIAWAWFKAAARPGEVLGVAVSLCGVLAIVSRGALDALAGLRFGVGDMMIIASVFIWSVYTVLLTHWPSRLATTSFLAVIAVFGWIMLIPFYLIERVFVGDPEITIALAGAIVYVGVFSSVVAFLGWNFGVKAIGAQRTSGFQHLVPAFAALQAVFFLGERIYPYHVVGIGLILGGLWRANRNRA